MALEKSIEHLKSILKNFEEDNIRADKFISLVKKYTDFSELTTPMINEFVDKILVHEGKWDNYERTQEVEVYLNFIGKFELPQEEPIELTQEELDELEKLRKKREKKREYNYRYLKKKKASMEKNYDFVVGVVLKLHRLFYFIQINMEISKFSKKISYNYC